ncbi:MAG: hypothetical protein WCO12_00585 [bacterium]
MKKKNVSFFQSRRLAALVIEAWFIKNWIIENPDENFAEDASRRMTRYGLISMLFVTCCIGDLTLLKSPQPLATLLIALSLTALICVAFLRARSDVRIFTNQIENWLVWQDAAKILARKLSLEFVTFPSLIRKARTQPLQPRVGEALQYSIGNFLHDAMQEARSLECADPKSAQKLRQDSTKVYELGKRLGFDVERLVRHHSTRPLQLYAGFWY